MQGNGGHYEPPATESQLQAGWPRLRQRGVSSFASMYKTVYEVATWLFSLLSLASMLGVAVLMMYLALHRSTDLLQDRLYENKRAWARKWLARSALWLIIALCVLVVDGVLSAYR
jgi:hypothetical protein